MAKILKVSKLEKDLEKLKVNQTLKETDLNIDQVKYLEDRYRFSDHYEISKIDKKGGENIYTVSIEKISETV